MNNGIFGLDSPQTFSNPNINSLVDNPSIVPSIYGINLNKLPQVNYNNLVFVINTANESTNIFNLPLAGTVNCTVDWGDGIVEKFTTSGNKSHTYSSRGEYIIQISGTVSSFTFSTASLYQPKLTKCLSFGNLPLTSFNFQSCSNLIQVPSNLPTGVTSLLNCFYGCTNFNWPIDSWDISRVNSLASTFYGCSSFNRDLTSWNTSNVTNMSYTFYSCSKFNSNISTWNTSRVTTTTMMFYLCPFNQSVSSWNTSSLTTCDSMFRASSFNQNINDWNVGKVSNFSFMFGGASNFNQPLSGWNLGADASVTGIDMSYLFYQSAFNQDISNWNTNKVITMQQMFQYTPFNQTVSGWDTSNVASMNTMFAFNTVFNKPIESWNVRKVNTFQNMFQGATSFNQPLSGWATTLGTDASVTTINMSNMFNNSAFNQPIGTWNTSKVTDMNLMFANQYTNAFNQDINSWNVSNVTNMAQMFYINKGMSYNLNSWNVSKVTSMQSMFYQSVFNGNISGWNINAVTNMSSMFFQSPFNQNISYWNVSGVQNMSAMFQGATAFNQDISSWNFKGLNATANFDNFMTSVTTFSTSNYNSLLVSMNNNKANYRTDLRPNFGSSKNYASPSAAATARAALVTYGWTITDGGTVIGTPDAPTTVAGTPGNAQVALTWSAPTYNNGASITDYTIQYSSNSGSSWTTFSHVASTSTSITVTGLTNNTAYIFRVAAVNSAGTGSYSSNSSSVTPVSGSTFSNFNSTWTAIGFTGSGTSASPYTRTGYASNMVPAQATVVSTGTVRITGQLRSDFGVNIYKNGIAVYTLADAYGGNGGNYTINATISVTAGDIIVFGSVANTDVYDLTGGLTLNIWWQSAFTPTAVLLTSGTSYTVPTGATSMKAWAVGSGQGGNGNQQNVGRAGGTSYKTWAVTGGNTVTYAIGSSGGNTTITFSGTTITGQGGTNGGSFSGGDGGANGGAGVLNSSVLDAYGGAVGGNGTQTSCKRYPATDVSGLLSAVSLAGGTISETCATTAAFGSGGAQGKYTASKTPGLGGGGATGNVGVMAGGGGAVILYFT